MVLTISLTADLGLTRTCGVFLLPRQTARAGVESPSLA
jgi:hypothetical protein